MYQCLCGLNYMHSAGVSVLHSRRRRRSSSSSSSTSTSTSRGSGEPTLTVEGLRRSLSELRGAVAEASSLVDLNLIRAKVEDYEAAASYVEALGSLHPAERRRCDNGKRLRALRPQLPSSKVAARL